MLAGTYQSMGVPLNFSPADVSNFVGWFKADAGTYQDAAGTTPASADADPVGLWQDQSGQANHVTQPVDAVRPTYRTNVKNGLPAIRCVLASTQSLRFLTAGGLNIARNVGAISIYAVCVSSTTPADGRVVGFDTGSLGSVRIALVRNLDGSNAGRLAGAYRRLDADARSSLDGGAGTYTNGVWDIEAVLVDFTNGLAYLRKNGSGLAFASTGNVGSTSDTASADARIGGGQTQWFDGDVGEVLIYQKLLTAVEISRVEGYLNNRWGVF